MPPDTPSLLPVRIAHARTAPRKNAFAYGALYLVLPLDTLKERAEHAVFSFERFNLFAFHARDHGDGSGDLQGWVREVLRRFERAGADGNITLVTLPRILGFAFNPVSFWLCRTKSGALHTVIAEVNNTFGERHFYVCGHDDGRPIEREDWLRSDKVFHVSPFLKVEGHYRFRFAIDGARVGIFINHFKGEDLRLATSMAGECLALTSARLVRGFLANPLIAVKVIGLIHWQALKLALKGLTYRSKPKPPEMEYSR